MTREHVIALAALFEEHPRATYSATGLCEYGVLIVHLYEDGSTPPVWSGAITAAGDAYETEAAVA